MVERANEFLGYEGFTCYRAKDSPDGIDSQSCSQNCFEMLIQLRNNTESVVGWCHSRLRFLRLKPFLVMRFFANLPIFSSKQVLLASGPLVLVLLGLVRASEGVDQFWSELGISQNPESLLRDILSRQEFKESYWASFFGSLIRWFIEVVTKLLARIFGGWGLDIEAEMVWTGVGAFFAVVLLAAILVGVFFAVRSFLSRSGKPPGPPSSSSPVFESSHQHLGLARSMAERGEYRDALIHLFRYALISLGEQGRLGFYAGKTNREILQSRHLVRSDRELLCEMIPIFNCIRYGDFPCGKAEYERFLTLTDRLVRLSEVS
ncbi:MAG: hypothetical protein HY912_05695 [Desulfomonile tiedjei]|uniref:DUF4129 domain-containing protein n=1 Tax=Desulfomonile tiedjei TaxID=2358 RepID=A0A9D6Z2N9_9BACT|nr:hypothetical protein [Desulfomonile tiedjei]